MTFSTAVSSKFCRSFDLTSIPNPQLSYDSWIMWQLLTKNLKQNTDTFKLWQKQPTNVKHKLLYQMKLLRNYYLLLLRLFIIFILYIIYYILYIIYYIYLFIYYIYYLYYLLLLCMNAKNYKSTAWTWMKILLNMNCH